MHVLPIRLITLPAANIHPQDKVSSINPQTISWITIYIISDIQISKSNILCNNKLLNKKTTHFTEWKRRATPNSPHPGYGVDLIVPPPWQGLKLGFFLPWFHAGFHQRVDMRVPHQPSASSHFRLWARKKGKKSGKVCLRLRSRYNRCPTIKFLVHSTFHFFGHNPITSNNWMKRWNSESFGI